MSGSTVAIIGSGPVGTAVAHFCAHHDIDVTVFEKGPAYFPFPFVDAFVRARVALYPHAEPLAQGLQGLDQEGDYKGDLNEERIMVVGGTGTGWGGLTPRHFPSDYRTRSTFGYGMDWPLSYDELEPYVCRAESFLGVSGTDDDNPFAPRRSLPFPLPPFELSYYDKIIAERAKQKGIIIHTTPQARARKAHDGRSGCMNFGACDTCPTGAMYAPNHHLQQAIATKRCVIRTDTSVRRIVVSDGRVRGLVVQHNDSAKEEEHTASIIVVAGGTLETTRLLMLSADSANPDGLGNASGHLGQHVMFKRIYRAHLHFKEKVYPYQAPYTAQSQQFVDNDTRGKHGGLKVNLSALGPMHSAGDLVPRATQRNLAEPVSKARREEFLEPIQMVANCMRAALLCESTPSPGTYLALAKDKDRFGDPFARVRVQSSEFDQATYRYAAGIVERIQTAVGASELQVPPFDAWATGHHHYGGARMSRAAADGVVSPFGEVHGASNLFVLGGAMFVTQSCNNPTLTMVALAIRSAELVAERAKQAKKS